MDTEPKTLQQAIVYFADADNCLNFISSRRWPNGVACPVCGSTNVSFVASRRVWQCKTRHPKSQFSVKVGTIFEDSPIGLDKWLVTMWMLANCKNGISSWEIHRAIGVTQKSAWFMLHRVRLALQGDSGSKFTGETEADETFVGGKAQNMHADKRARRITGTGGKDKVVVMGILERGGEARAKVVKDRTTRELVGQIRQHVEPGTVLYTDALPSYKELYREYEHGVIDHAVKYVEGQVHTNGIENFWSLLKRSLKGTYVAVEPFHLDRYLDEQVFRFNNRKGMNDGDRFSLAVSKIVGKRLTFAELTGKDGKISTH